MLPCFPEKKKKKKKNQKKKNVEKNLVFYACNSNLKRPLKIERGVVYSDCN